MESEDVQNVVCNVCGGTDFIKEVGYYYCTECQTQTQELREQTYEGLDRSIQPERRVTTGINKKINAEKQSKITSWEGYNYILAGLVNELIELGAKSELKEITYQLWIAYLIELEILTKTGYKKPKLAIRYKPKDAELVYQHRKRKRKRTRSQNSTDSIDTDSNSRQLSRERNKKKKAMVNLEYKSFTANTQSSDTSILNQTLSTVGSSEDESLESEKYIQYNKFSRKELLKHMSHKHLRKHMKDYEGKMKCHKDKAFLTATYRRSSYVMRRDKLYSIIYIGLLLTENEMQLSDLLRYCREGHVSFLSYNHFFPETYTEKQIDRTVYQIGHKVIPSHKNIRETAYKIYHMLKLDPFDFCPDINKLCEKYCLELNLPDEIKQMALNIINATEPEFKTKLIKEGCIPNYEGRIMAFVILVLKLLFGLDGVTEFKFSDFATNINNKCKYDNKMFVFSDWIKFIEYRKIVLKSQHFPICFLLNDSCRSDLNLFASFLHKQRLNMDDDTTKLSVQVKQKLLTDLEDLQDHRIGSSLDFSPTLTPFHSYLQQILSHNVRIYDSPLQRDVLSDVTKSSVDYLLNPKKYLQKLNGSDYVIIENGANTNTNFMKIISKGDKKTGISTEDWQKSFTELKSDELYIDTLENKILRVMVSKVNNKNVKPTVQLPLKHPEITVDLVLSKSAEKRKSIVVRDSKGRFCKNESSNKNENEPRKRKKRGEWFISSWTKNPLFEQNLDETTNEQNVEKTHVKHKNKIKEPGYNVHYEPHKEYWINVANLDHRHFDMIMWKDLKNSLPFTFLWLLNECSMIIEQDPKDLYEEFILVELYFIYIHLKKTTTSTNSGKDNSESIIKLINSLLQEW